MNTLNLNIVKSALCLRKNKQEENKEFDQRIQGLRFINIFKNVCRV